MARGNNMMSLLRRYWPLSLVFLFAALAYGAALQGALFFQDESLLRQNPALAINGLVFDAWRTAALVADTNVSFQPLAMLSYAANHALFGGFSPFTLKAVNLLTHLSIGALIYNLATAVLRSPVFGPYRAPELRLLALCAAAIWLLHPLHVSTVLYATQRTTQLSTLLSVLGLCVFLHYRLRWAARGTSVGELMALCLWLALLVVAAGWFAGFGLQFSLFLVVTEVTLFRGRWRGKEVASAQLLGWLALLSLLLVVSLFQLSHSSTGLERGDVSLLDQAMTQSRFLWRYLQWLFLPDITAMGFGHNAAAVSRGLLQPFTTLISLIAWLAVLLAAYGLRHRFPMFLFALLFFFVGHLPSSVPGLPRLSEQSNYLASIGLCLLFVQVLASLRLGNNRLVTGARLAAPLVILLLLLIARSQIWSARLPLAQANVLNHPTSSRAHYLYADTLLARVEAIQDPGRKRDQGQALVVAARQHLLQAQQGEPEAIATLLKLMYTDSLFFPRMPQQASWLRLLQQAVPLRAIQPSDLRALSQLLKCATSGRCQVSGPDIEAVLNDLVDHNKGDVRLLLLKYEYLLAVGAPVDQRTRVLENATVLAPYHPSVVSYAVMEKGQNGNVAGMYDLVRNWLANDPDRRDLPTIMSLFATPVEGAKPVQDTGT